MKNIFLLFILFFAALTAYAGPKKVTYEHPWLMRSVAALGMGDAYYVKSDNKYAPFYNPAGLTRIKGWSVDILPVNAGESSNLMDFYNDFKDIDTDDNSQVAGLLKKYIGDDMNASVSFYPAFSKHNFTFGIFGTAQVSAIASNPVIPELNVAGAADFGVVAGVGMSFFEDRLQTGISAKVQRRLSVERTFTVADIVNGEFDNFEIDDYKEEATGFFVDLGVIYNFYLGGLNPRIGVAVNNLGTNSMGDALDIPYSINLSAGISPSYGIISSDFIIDIRDITQNFDDVDWMKRINLGAEIRVYDIFAVRAGVHQGYLSCGAGLYIKDIFEIDYAYYAEELGASAGQRPSRRYALELAFGF